MWTTRGEGKKVLPWGYVEYFLRIQIFVGERQQKKPICYFGLTLCCDPKLLLLLEGHKSIEGGFGDTTRINIPMAIVAIELSEVDLEQKKQLPVTVQERISSAASDCVVLMGPLPRKLKKLSISTRYGTEGEEGASSDQYLFFQRIILAILHLFTCTKDVLFGCPLSLAGLCF